MNMLRFATVRILPVLCLLLVSCAEDIPEPLTGDHLLSLIDSQPDETDGVIINIEPVGPDSPVDVVDPTDQPVNNEDIVLQSDDITVVVGPGVRPMIAVSEPIYDFYISDDDFILDWGFDFFDEDDNPIGDGFVGQFEYGIAPIGSNLWGDPDPPDLIGGVTYFIEITTIKNMFPIFVDFVFTR